MELPAEQNHLDLRLLRQPVRHVQGVTDHRQWQIVRNQARQVVQGGSTVDEDCVVGLNQGQRVFTGLRFCRGVAAGLLLQIECGGPVSRRSRQYVAAVIREPFSVFGQHPAHCHFRYPEQRHCVAQAQHALLCQALVDQRQPVLLAFANCHAITLVGLTSKSV